MHLEYVIIYIMIILDDDVTFKRIPAKKDNRVFKFNWRQFELFKEIDGKEQKIDVNEDLLITQTIS